jgi:hypothetical protein
VVDSRYSRESLFHSKNNSMNYWLALFTVKMLEEFQEDGANISGFRGRRFHTCKQIQPGDKLLCYVTGIGRGDSVLRVNETVYRSEERIWDMKVFPFQLGIEPEVLLPPEHGIPHELLLPASHSPAPSWSGYLQGNPGPTTTCGRNTPTD